MAARGPISWQRQLVAVWFSQFLVIAAFSIGLPFMPYFIQELGVREQNQVLFWTSVCQGAAPLVFIFAAPLWGAAADQWGRRPMLLRANAATVFVLLGLAMAPSVEWLVFWRVCQGLFTGTVSAARTMVVVSAPEHRHGLVLGALSTALFCGLTVGQAMGGLLADLLGYRMCFIVGSMLAALATLVVVFASREDFRRPQPLPASEHRRGRRRWFPRIHGTLPILLLIGGSAMVMHMALPVLPLLVQELRGTIRGSSVVTGSMLAAGAVAAAVAGVVIGIANDRFGAVRVASLCSLGAAGACVPMALAAVTGIPGLYLGQILGAFMAAGLDPAFQAWLVRHAPVERRGAILGWAFTASSIGWMLGPLGASGIAVFTGLAPVYWVRAAGFIAVIPLCWWAARMMMRRNSQPAGDASDA